MQIVAVQLNMVWEDRLANHARIRQLLSDAAVEAGSMVILPEMFESGFSMNLGRTAQSESREGESLLRELAAEYDCAVMGGVAAPVVEGVSKNEAVVFAPDGAELARYQKMQPFSHSNEGDYYPAGRGHRTFQWQGVTIAPFICYDLRFPELFRAAIDDGAEVLTVIACWPSKRSEHWVRLLQARAIENLAAVVGVNRCGREPGLDFDGRSAAFDHMGQPLFEATDEEQVLKTTFDIEAVRGWRDFFPALRDRVVGA